MSQNNTTLDKGQVKGQVREQESGNELSASELANIESIENEIESSNRYFKPKPDKIYMLKLDLKKDKIVPVENDRFKDASGKPLKRYELIVTHVNTGVEQIWTVSKTVCLQIIEELRKKRTILQVERIGEDKNTVYRIKGVQ
jgi:hypothetical protein